MALKRLCELEEVKEGEPFQVVLDGGDALAVYRVGEEIFVAQDKCNHAGASLSLEGFQEGYTITCSWHDAKFDVRDGRVLGGPCSEPMRVISAIVKDGCIFADI